MLPTFQTCWQQFITPKHHNSGTKSETKKKTATLDAGKEKLDTQESFDAALQSAYTTKFLAVPLLM